MRVMVVGIPNVGKSTFINKMAKNNMLKQEIDQELLKVNNGLKLDRNRTFRYSRNFMA